MLRARSRLVAERPTYDTVPRMDPPSSRSSVAFHAHDTGLVKSGDCMDMTSGKLRTAAPPGLETAPLITVCISESGGLNPYAAVVLICTRFRNRPMPARSVVRSLRPYANPSRGWKPFFGVSEKPFGTP